jgi:hypothetical protein
MEKTEQEACESPHAHHEVDPDLYTKSRVDKDEYAIRVKYEEKKLFYQTGGMLIASLLIGLFFFIYLNSHIRNETPVAPAL